LVAPPWDEGEREAMRWFRSNIRFGARLALAALALQIALTFGHVHDLAVAQAQSAPSASTSEAGTALPSTPNPNRKSSGGVDFDCPLCALIQLASTSAPSVAPVLPVPAMIFIVRLKASDELEWTPSFHFSFQARGPPSI
jgi:hypothetical protein